MDENTLFFLNFAGFIDKNSLTNHTPYASMI